MSVSSFSPAGAANYASNSLHVGDGTWDTERDTFLLPNIQGLPFDVMRYNGMSNRFAALPQYHSMIIGHGILAAITFLLVVPMAIFVARFYHANPAFALRAHITLQILTVILTTIIFILGYFAVGPQRSLTNPHHVIGLTIYVLIWIQVIGGSIIHRVEKGRRQRLFKAIKLMIHEWLGRALALLAFAQVPIGLTLYGSPAWTFILYSVWMATLTVAYFVLIYRMQNREDPLVMDSNSYGLHTDSGDNRSNTRGRVMGLTGGITGIAGIQALRRRFSGAHQRTESERSMLGQEHQSHSTKDYVEEKFTDYSESESPGRRLKHRFLGGLAGMGVIPGMRRLSARISKENRGHQERIGPLHATQSGVQSKLAAEETPSPSADSMSRMEAGVFRRGDSFSPYSDAQQMPYNDPAFHEGRHNLEGLKGDRLQMPPTSTEDVFKPNLHVRAKGLASWFRPKTSQEDPKPVDDQWRHHDPRKSYGATGQSATLDSDEAAQREYSSRPSVTEHGRTRTSFLKPDQAPYRLQDLPYPSTAPQIISSPSYSPSALHPIPTDIPRPPPSTMNIPPTPPVHNSFPGLTRPIAGSVPGQDGDTPHLNAVQRGSAHEEEGHAYTLATANASRHTPVLHQPAIDSTTQNTTGSPPVSVRVRMHNDGRHVTLQRLQPSFATEQSSLQKTVLAPTHISARDHFTSPTEHNYDDQNAMAEDSHTGTGLQSSDMSASRPDENRRRRRAERARAAQAREMAKGSRSVDFSR